MPFPALLGSKAKTPSYPGVISPAGSLILSTPHWIPSLFCLTSHVLKLYVPFLDSLTPSLQTMDKQGLECRQHQPLLLQTMLMPASSSQWSGCQEIQPQPSLYCPSVRLCSLAPTPNSSPSLEIPDVSPDSGGMCLFFFGNPGAAVHSGRSLCLRKSLNDRSTRGCHVTLDF